MFEVLRVHWLGTAFWGIITSSIFLVSASLASPESVPSVRSSLHGFAFRLGDGPDGRQKPERCTDLSGTGEGFVELPLNNRVFALYGELGFTCYEGCLNYEGVSLDTAKPGWSVFVTLPGASRVNLRSELGLYRSCVVPQVLPVQVDSTKAPFALMARDGRYWPFFFMEAGWLAGLGRRTSLTDLEAVVKPISAKRFERESPYAVNFELEVSLPAYAGAFARALEPGGWLAPTSSGTDGAAEVLSRIGALAELGKKAIEAERGSPLRARGEFLRYASFYAAHHAFHRFTPALTAEIKTISYHLERSESALKRAKEALRHIDSLTERELGNLATRVEGAPLKKGVEGIPERRQLETLMASLEVQLRETVRKLKADKVRACLLLEKLSYPYSLGYLGSIALSKENQDVCK